MSLGAENFANTAQVHERSIVLADGVEHALWFRELTNVEVRRWALQRQSNSVDVVAAADAQLASLCLCTPNGEPVLTFEKACTLKTAVLDRLVAAALDVNELRKPEPDSEGNGSVPEQSSGSGTL